MGNFHSSNLDGCFHRNDNEPARRGCITLVSGSRSNTLAASWPFCCGQLAPAFYFPKTDIPYLFLAMLTLVAYGLFATRSLFKSLKKGSIATVKSPIGRPSAPIHGLSKLTALSFSSYTSRGDRNLCHGFDTDPVQEQRGRGSIIAPAGRGPTRRAAAPPSCRSWHQF